MENGFKVLLKNFFNQSYSKKLGIITAGKPKPKLNLTTN